MIRSLYGCRLLVLYKFRDNAMMQQVLLATKIHTYVWICTFLQLNCCCCLLAFLQAYLSSIPSKIDCAHNRRPNRQLIAAHILASPLPDEQPQRRQHLQQVANEISQVVSIVVLQAMMSLFTVKGVSSLPSVAAAAVLHILCYSNSSFLYKRLLSPSA